MSILEQRVQEALDRGALDADLRAELEAETAEAQAARALVEVDDTLRSLSHAPAFDVVAGVLSRLDEPLADIGDILADPSFDVDLGPAASSPGAANPAIGSASLAPALASTPADVGAASGGNQVGDDNNVVELASRRRWRAPLWLGGGLAAAAALALVMTTKLDAPQQEAASVAGYADQAVEQEEAPYPLAEQASAPADGRYPGAEPAAPAAAAPAEAMGFEDETAAAMPRSANQVGGATGSGGATGLAAPDQDDALLDRFQLAETSRGVRGGAREAALDFEEDQAEAEASDTPLARSRRSRTTGASSGMIAAMAAMAPPEATRTSMEVSAPTTTASQAQGGDAVSVESRALACVTASELGITLSAANGRVVRAQVTQTLSAEERRCIDRVLLGTTQSAAVRRVTFRR